MGYHHTSLNHSPSELQNMRYTNLILVITAALLTGCISVYKTDTQQGNVVTQEMVDKLKPGMTRSQVRFVLGTPLIIDQFHPDRWDYYYLFKKGNEVAAQARRLTVLFKNDQLLGVQGDLTIKEQPAAAEGTSGSLDLESADGKPLTDDLFPRMNTREVDSPMHGTITDPNPTTGNKVL